jgi:predicted MFS family arabinose efflux permease
LAQNIAKVHNSRGILFLSALSIALFIAVPMSSMPVLFKEISQDLSLNSVQIGIIWGVLSFGGIIMSLIGGIVCDRLGYKRSIVILGLLCGFTGAARGLSNGFPSLLLTTLIWGIISSALAPTFTMICSVCASRQRQGFAQGLLVTGGALGLAAGSMISSTVLSPLLGGWRNVFFMFGGVTILVSLYWLIKIRIPSGPKHDIGDKQVSFRKAMSSLLRSKPLWILSISFMAYQGCTMGMQGYIAYFLEDSGWSVLAASGVLSLYCLIGAIFAVPGTLLSDRIGSRKNILYWAFFTAVIGVGLISVMHNGYVWVLIAVAGLFGFVTNALFITMCIEILYKESSYVGTGVGWLLCISNVGRSIAPPIGNSFADISSNISWPFVFWALLGTAGAVVLIFVKETGWKHKKKF